MIVLGLMSGTSMDGLDCCLCDIYLDDNYNFEYSIIDTKTYLFTKEIRMLINDAINNLDVYGKINERLGIIYNQYVIDFIKNRKIDLVGLHGQTISHINGVSTKQIGSPLPLNNSLSIPIIYNFREADISASGNGAPLMPYLDWLLFNKLDISTITLNIGGIANITLIKPNQYRKEVIGFDTGPGMSLIDEFVKLKWNKDLDYNAKYSSKGKINNTLLDYLLKNHFINQKPPKSTGRKEFGKQYILKLLKQYKYINNVDILRTLVTFTAKSIALNIKNHFKFSSENTQMIINGGGIHHPLLIKDIKKYINIDKFVSLMNYNIDPDYKEALLMAVLAVSKK